MKVEIVEFYPFPDSKAKTSGTLHVFISLPDKKFDFDLRGLSVKKTKKDYFITFPTRQTIDEETKEKIRYPFFSFLNQELNKQIISELRLQLPKFMEKKFPNEMKYSERKPKFRRMNKI